MPKAAARSPFWAAARIIRSALKAQEILAERYDVAADVWSAHSLQNFCASANAIKMPSDWNMLQTRPRANPRIPRRYGKREGTFRSRLGFTHEEIVPDQIAPWVPGGLTTLGTDGFG